MLLLILGEWVVFKDKLKHKKIFKSLFNQKSTHIGQYSLAGAEERLS